MIRMLFCLHRLLSLSLAEFQTYWLETHAPLVARHAAGQAYETAVLGWERTFVHPRFVIPDLIRDPLRR